MQQAIQALKDTLGSEDAGQIKAKTEALAQAVDEARRGDVQGAAGRRRGEGGRPARGRPGQGGSGDAGGDDKVVDADFEEVDDQKKRGSA